jgi:hypothetical protein
MKHAAIIEHHRGFEPQFELPPRFAGLLDRRIGGRATAQWACHRSPPRLPAADALRVALAAGGAHLIWLSGGSHVAELNEIGLAVVAAFGLEPGPLAVDTAFGRALGTAYTKSIAESAPVQFEGAFARHPTAPATLLTRGTVLPVASESAVDPACAIITWTELLAPVDGDRLRRELLAAVAAAPSNRPPPAPAMW